MQQINYSDCGQSADQKDHIEPAMVEVEVQSAQHLGDDDAILRRHVHAHQQNRRAEVHAHNLGHDKHNDVRRFAGRDFVEKLYIQKYD